MTNLKTDERLLGNSKPPTMRSYQGLKKSDSFANRKPVNGNIGHCAIVSESVRPTDRPTDGPAAPEPTGELVSDPGSLPASPSGQAGRQARRHRKNMLLLGAC